MGRRVEVVERRFDCHGYIEKARKKRDAVLAKRNDSLRNDGFVTRVSSCQCCKCWVL